jgi:hypothetical protein
MNVMIRRRAHKHCVLLMIINMNLYQYKDQIRFIISRYSSGGIISQLAAVISFVAA